MKKHLLGILFLAVLIVSGCKDDKETANQGYSDGIIVVNEGTFQVGNSSISHYDPSTGMAEQDIFQTVNGRPLGDVAQSIDFFQNKAFIVVNNSNKVEVVDAVTFQEMATISQGLSLPREFLGINSTKGYVSEWGNGTSGQIKIIDLNTYAVIDSINTGGVGPDKMKFINNMVYVGHSGGYGSDQLFTIINPDTDEVINTINTSYNPNEIVVDGEGNIWVLSIGYFDFITYESFPAMLTMYNPNTMDVVKEFELPGNYPTDLQINSDGNTLFFIFNSQIVSMNTSSTTLDLTNLTNGNNFYALGYDSEEQKLYASNAGDFVSEGEIMIFNESGENIGSFDAGVIPGHIFTEN